MAVVVTPGAANANSYASVSECDKYHENHPYGATWLDASDELKEQALITTARLIDADPRAWTGEAASETQAMGWPRKGMFSRNGFAIPDNVNPVPLKDAHCEYARQYIEENRSEDDVISRLGINKIKASSVEIGFGKKTSTNGPANPHVDRVTQQLDAQMAMMPDVVRMILVPSWLKPDPAQEEIDNNLVFKAI